MSFPINSILLQERLVPKYDQSGLSGNERFQVIQKRQFWGGLTSFIRSVALTVFSCGIALLSENVRAGWRGKEIVKIKVEGLVTDDKIRELAKSGDQIAQIVLQTRLLDSFCNEEQGKTLHIGIKKQLNEEIESEINELSIRILHSDFQNHLNPERIVLENAKLKLKIEDEKLHCEKRDILEPKKKESASDYEKRVKSSFNIDDEDNQELRCKYRDKLILLILLSLPVGEGKLESLAPEIIQEKINLLDKGLDVIQKYSKNGELKDKRRLDFTKDYFEKIKPKYKAQQQKV